jgi:hypothetical protein
MAVLRTTIRLLVLGLSLAGTGVRADEPRGNEYQVKAAFLYNLAVLTEWPTNALPAGDSPLVIGVLGADPFGAVLDETLRNKRIGPHPVRVARFARVEDVRDCHLLFVAGAEDARLPAIITALANRPILTVGDVERFGARGGMVRLAKRADGTIGLRINPGAAQRAGLKLSSRLLRLATLVTTEEGGTP